MGVLCVIAEKQRERSKSGWRLWTPFVRQSGLRGPPTLGTGRAPPHTAGEPSLGGRGLSHKCQMPVVSIDGSENRRYHRETGSQVTSARCHVVFHGEKREGNSSRDSGGALSEMSSCLAFAH